MPRHDDPTAQAFFEAYTAVLERTPEAPSLSEAAVQAVDARRRRSTRRLGWAAAAAAAVVTLLLIGVIPWIVGSSDDSVVDEPTTTTVAPPTSTSSAPPTTEPVPLPETTVTTIVEAGLPFAPALAATGALGEGGERGGFSDFAVHETQLEFGSHTLEVWEASWSARWSRIFGYIIDPENPDLYRFPEGTYCTQMVPDESLIIRTRCGSRSLDDAVARLQAVFTGTDQAWSVDLIHLETGEEVGTITGSFPGLSEDEILHHLVNEGRIGWYFVTDAGGRIEVFPPWYEFFLRGWEPELLAIGDALVAVSITEAADGDRWTIWRTADGRRWDEIGLAPWVDEAPPPCPPACEVVSLDTLVVIDEQIYALTTRESDSWIDDGDVVVPGTFEIAYWSSPDGIDWAEINREDWKTRTGGLLPAWCASDDPEPPAAAAACEP